MGSEQKLLNDQAALGVLRSALSQSGLSLRSAAALLGLRSHAELSRVLSGRRRPSAALLLELCRWLKIEGRPLEVVLAALLPSASPALAQQVARQTHAKAGLPVSKPFAEPLHDSAGTGSRVCGERTKNIRFFSHVYAPLVFEALKILGPATRHAIYDSFSGALRLDPEGVDGALNSLQSNGFVSQGNDKKWSVVGEKRDLVVPSGTTPREGLESMKFALRNAQMSLAAEGKRIMRSTLVSTRTPAGARPVDALRPLLMNLQDDLLAQQSPDDDAAVQVLISVVEIARTPVEP